MPFGITIREKLQNHIFIIFEEFKNYGHCIHMAVDITQKVCKISHDVYKRGCDEEQIPRHKEINEMLAKAILKKWGIE